MSLSHSFAAEISSQHFDDECWDECGLVGG
jgi:hypothetical protein